MTRAPGRNEPCPCGSGKKYKKCHGADDEARRDSLVAGKRISDLGAKLTVDIFEFAHARFGEAWEVEVFGPFFDPDYAIPLVFPYAAYHVPIEGRLAVEHFLEERGSGLSADAAACLRAGCEAWLSIWQVQSVRLGEGLTLRDRLSGEVREIHERTASRTLVAGDTVLARVLDVDGYATFNGLYPRALPPHEGAEVERRSRGHLRRKREVPVERLRQPGFLRYLIRRFEDAVWDLRERRMPQLVNTDGDPILMTTDHFSLAKGAFDEVARRIAGLKGVDDPEETDDALVFHFLGRNDVVLGRASLTERGLHVETNSRERADRLRRSIERACEGLLRHRAREHSDPLSSAGPVSERVDPPETSPETRELVRTLKQQHYVEWLDTSIPALDGQTPRAAVATATGRARVEVLLEEIEYAEQRLDPEERIDVAPLRRELGLDDESR